MLFVWRVTKEKKPQGALNSNSIVRVPRHFCWSTASSTNLPGQVPGRFSSQVLSAGAACVLAWDHHPIAPESEATMHSRSSVHWVAMKRCSSSQLQAASHSPLSTSLDHRLGMSALLAQHLLQWLARQPVPSSRFLLDALCTAGQGHQGTCPFLDVILPSGLPVQGGRSR